MSKKVKVMLWCLIGFLIFFIPIFTFLSISIEKQHRAIIEDEISNNGGQIIEVIKVSQTEWDKTPFAEELRSYNTLYKIVYEKAGKTNIAWYRGLNIVNDIHGERAVRKAYKEMWIFE